MKCVIVDDTLESAWQEYVDASPDAMLAHDIKWRKIVSKSMGHTPVYLAALEGNEFRGVLPLFYLKHRILGKRLVSIPLLDQAGVLSSDDNARMLILDKIRQMMVSENIVYAQVRSPIRELNGKDSKKAVLILPLVSDIDDLWNTFKTNIRNSIRKAEKSGLDVVIGGSESAADFYGIYARNMRDLGVPALPFTMIHKTTKTFGDDAKIILVTKEGRVIGGGVSIFYRKSVTIPWASSLRSYFDYCPNNILYWSFIKMAYDRGCDTMDFGRSTRDSGPYKFKKQWGTIEYALNWDYFSVEHIDKPEFNTDNPKYRLIVEGWKHLPVPVANLLGSKISCHLV